LKESGLLPKKDYLKDFQDSSQTESSSRPTPFAPSPDEPSPVPTVAPVVQSLAPSMDLPSPIPTVAPVATALPVQQPISTLSPSNVLSPTAAPTFRPSGESIEMCSDNIPVTVTLGPRSNPSGSFVNLPTQQSLENVVDCLDIDQGEQHTQSSHVWWNPGPIELIFEFNDVEYNIRDVYFWNYFGV